MLQLNHIKKIYVTGDLKQAALDDVSINFRENEFVAILGQSGSGKTTLLNIVGGLDRYTSGDLLINGISTKRYKDRDWDYYRNHSIGFVFQSYNLIPHQSVLANVELAMTLAGVSKGERRRRATEVLQKVGLGDQLHKRPNQMSGGQMQRVAIARALVNNPDILLADEPTGALDSATSIQIMELLKEIARDKLVIMVTHNPDLADEYATRIIRLLDGHVTDDTDPFTDEEASQGVLTDTSGKKGRQKIKHKKKVSMSFFTALALSFNNLRTKKGRTILTAFAGSIGIIGIALILSLSSGVQEYIARVERDTLSSYPITIESQSVDWTSMLEEGRPDDNADVTHPLDKVYQRGSAVNTLTRTTVKTQTNDLEAFKTYLDSDAGKAFRDASNAIKYGYRLNLQIYKADTSDGVVRVNPSDITNFSSNMNGMSMSSSYSPWTKLIDNQDLLDVQYDVLAGSWPKDKSEVVVFVDENNEINDLTLYALGLKSQEEYDEIAKKIEDGETVDPADYPTASFSYDDILGLEYKVLPNSEYYEKSGDVWIDKSTEEAYVKDLLDKALTLKVVGIVRPTGSVSSTSTGTVGYLAALTEYVIDENNNSLIAKMQKKHASIDVFTGKEFSTDGTASTMDASMLSGGDMTDEEMTALMQSYAASSTATYEDNLSKIGIADKKNPATIELYPKDFASKDVLSGLIDDYNAAQTDAGKEQFVISYTDFVGIMMSAVTDIVQTITYVLIAFVGISLVVSSIMIGIITYISVLERTKEIGILRSIGASKHDISRVFNAETMIIGLCAGLIGIGVTILLNIPINILIESIADVKNLSALPVYGAVTLVAISVVLTIISGLIPSKVASKKDPVEALRTE